MQIRLLLDTQDSLPPGKWAGGAFDQGLDLLGTALITRHPGGEPQLRAPRLERVGLQDAAHGLEGNAGHDAIGLEVTGEFGAGPLGQGMPKLIRPFTSPLDHLECDLGRKDRRPTRTRPLVQTCCPLFAKAPGPVAHLAFAQANLPGCGSITRSLCEQQERTGASDQA